jgi:hypothetical protein
MNEFRRRRRTENHDWKVAKVGIGGNPGHDIESVHVRHVDIQQQQVRERHSAVWSVPIEIRHACLAIWNAPDIQTRVEVIESARCEQKLIVAILGNEQDGWSGRIRTEAQFFVPLVRAEKSGTALPNCVSLAQ